MKSTVTQYILVHKRPGWPDKRWGVRKREYLEAQESLGIRDSNPVPFNTPFEDGHYQGLVQEASYALPAIVEMESLPPHCNPFHYDSFNMGTDISGGWIAMYREHFGTDREGKPYPDPTYIILVNSRTGQRFRLDFAKDEGLAAVEPVEPVFKWVPIDISELSAQHNFVWSKRVGKRFYRLRYFAGDFSEVFAIYDSKTRKMVTLDSQIFWPQFDHHYSRASDPNLMNALLMLFYINVERIQDEEVTESAGSEADRLPEG